MSSYVNTSLISSDSHSLAKLNMLISQRKNLWRKSFTFPFLTDLSINEHVVLNIICNYSWCHCHRNCYGYETGQLKYFHVCDLLFLQNASLFV